MCVCVCKSDSVRTSATTCVLWRACARTMSAGTGTCLGNRCVRVCRDWWKRVEEATGWDREGERQIRESEARGRREWAAGLVGDEADCTRCAVRLTACALRRRPTTLLFEKGRGERGGGAARGGWARMRGGSEGEGGVSSSDDGS